MTVKIPFLNKETVPAQNIERGDVIWFIDQKTFDIQRGIVYSTVVNNQTNSVVGFRVLPVNTVGKGNTSASRFDFLEKNVRSIVEEVGGNANLQKAVVLFNLQSVAMVQQMTGVEEKGKIHAKGSFNGSPFMTELFQRVEDLYKEGRLYVDGKPATPDTKIKIVPPSVTKQDRIDNSAARREVFKAMEDANANLGGTTVGKKLEEKVRDFSLKAAFEGGYISECTALFLNDAKMQQTGKKPQTLLDAYEIVSKYPESLSQIFGLGKKGKIYHSIISEVTEAVKNLKPPSSDMK